MVLDADALQAITQEARNCFLYEDAPDYLALLEEGFRRLRSAKTGINLQNEYAALMRATHSLKGGAGIAQLPTLSQLAHKLEDLVQALHEERVPEPEYACELLSVGIEQVGNLIAQAINGDEIPETLPIFPALESFLASVPAQNRLSALASTPVTPTVELEISPTGSYLLKTALTVDLEECLQRVEQQLQKSAPKEAIEEALKTLEEECTLLGQALNQTWLAETARELREGLAQTNLPIEEIATTAIVEIRLKRSQVLSSYSQEVTPSLQPTTASPQPVQKQQPDPIPSSAVQTKEKQEPLPSQALNLRIPVDRLDRMNNTVGELLISYERLSLSCQQLLQTSQALKNRTQQSDSITEKVRALYDQLAFQLSLPMMGGYARDWLTSPTTRESESGHFNQYTAIDGPLQELQELMAQVQENRADVELIASELQETLDHMRQQLDSLRGDLTQSRLVPFALLADRFVAPLQTLNQQYHKSVELVVVGKDTLIDQVIIEQLQTPLTHLLRNAFDHGIETAEERQALGKPQTSKIKLSAVVQGNQVVIGVADDGRGIDTQKLYQRAVQIGLCRSGNPTKLTREQILDFLFAPGFSTAQTVTTLSGRGIGLDAVKRHVARLRGGVRVETVLGQGTKFTITIPLTLSILPLLLCRSQQRTLAIPSVNILEITDLSEFSIQAGSIVWHNSTVPLFPLIQLLPYRQSAAIAPTSPFDSQLGIVLDVNGKAVVVAVDSLLGERELVLKPFDVTVQVPPYVAGCTVLGTGEVVPVLYPNHFGELIAQASLAVSATDNASGVAQSQPELESEPTILVVDDSIAVRRMLDRVLSQSGYHVVQCRDGKEALEMLNKTVKHANLIICDIDMPRLDGLGFLKEIRSHPRWHSLPVVMLTSRENNLHRQKAMSLGATVYFTKPFRPAELLKCLNELITPS